MTIRLATPDDAEAIVAMLARLADETGDGARFASTPETIRAHGFGPGAMFETLIIATNGEPVGLALYFRHYSTTRGLPGVYVQDLWMAPGARGHGFGRRLLAAVAERARAGWGAAYLALTTHGGNTNARAAYARLGFVAQPGDVAMMLEGPAFSTLGKPAEART